MSIIHREAMLLEMSTISMGRARLTGNAIAGSREKNDFDFGVTDGDSVCLRNISFLYLARKEKH